MSIVDNSSLRAGSVFSISFWFKLSNISGNQVILYKGVLDGSDDVEYSIQFRTDNGNSLRYWLGANFNVDDHSANGSNVLNANVAYHVVMIYNGSLTGDTNRLKAYINGVQESLSFNAGGITSNVTALPGEFRFGVGSYNSNPFQYMTGWIDEGKFYNVAFTASQVAALYNNGFGSTCPPKPSLIKTSSILSVGGYYQIESAAFGIITSFWSVGM